MNSVPFVSMYEQMHKAFSTLQIDSMKSVEHEDNEFNDEFSVDPLADPRIDKFDLFNMVDTKDRDAIMSANPSFVASGGDDEDLSISEPLSGSGSGE